MTLTAAPTPSSARTSARTQARWSVLARRHVATPLILASALLALYAWVRSAPLDDIEARTLNATYLARAVVEHLRLTATATVIVVVVAVSVGILLTRPRFRWLGPFATGLANVGQATPAIGLLVLLSIWLGIGFWTAVIGLVAYAVLPVLRNTIAGLNQVDPNLVEAGRGIGMSQLAVLARVELPLALPVILAGIRTALVLAVGVATLATFVNAGGLGDMIVNGIKLQRVPVLVTGGVLTAVLALLIDWLGGVIEDLFRPRGLT